MNNMTRQKFLSDQELNDLFRLMEKHKGTRDYFLIMLTLYCGARSCEVLKVRKCDIGTNCVTISFPAKGSDARTVPLPAPFTKGLKEYAEQKGDQDVLFKISTRHFRRIWDQYRCARKPKLHGLRHTLGVRLYGNSKNIHAVKTFLGHRNIKNTMVYLEFVEGADQLRNETKGMWKMNKSA